MFKKFFKWIKESIGEYIRTKKIQEFMDRLEWYDTKDCRNIMQNTVFQVIIASIPAVIVTIGNLMKIIPNLITYPIVLFTIFFDKELIMNT